MHQDRSERQTNFRAGYPNLEVGVNLLRSQLAKREEIQMIHDYTRSLKFDRRLLRRRGWLDSEELEKELADLPDVSDKAQSPDEPNEPSPEPAEPPPVDE